MDIATYLRDLWALAAAALSLNTTALAEILAHPYAGWLALGLALAAAFSRLLGDSIVLFINRVTARRFVLALLGGAFLFVLELGAWGLSIWLIAALVLNVPPTLDWIVLVVAIASAPWLFGFLVFLPYLGLAVRWILRIWSWLILLSLLRDVLNIPLVNAFLIATLGWLALRALELILAPQMQRIQNRLWYGAAGPPTSALVRVPAD